MTDRLHCLVPFCKRTRGPHKGDPQGKFLAEWICGEHWRMTDRHRRRLMFRARRLGRHEVAHVLWDRLKRQAIERAMGVTG